MPKKLPLTLACGDYEIVRALKDGTVEPDEEVGLVHLMLSASTDAPAALLTNCVAVLDKYPALQGYLNERPDMVKAFVEDKNFDFLYMDADGYHFMNTDTYDQVQVPADVIGDQAQWLQEGMKVILSVFNGNPVAIQLPPRVTLEVIETEPAMKGQTASSSYKPARLANGARAMVPPHISIGVRIVIQTEDGSYVERAKD